MKRFLWLNPVLFVVLLCTAALAWFVPERDVRRPNFEFLPEAQMAQSPAYDSFAPNPDFADGLTLRTPPAGTIARGHPPLDYQPTLQDALRAGLELTNPYQPTDNARRDRGTIVFTNYCQVCHGPLGQGNGPVAQGGFPPPASLLADRALLMKDGQMFHVLTYGQGNMPSFAAQLSRDDRWNVILHVRMLQKPYTPGPVGSRLETVAKLFNQNCAACHGVDGTGANVRNILPLIPDFTSTAWQMSQTEMAIVNQIDYGSAPLMPAWRYKLTREEVLGLAVYIRSFASHVPAGQTPIVLTTHLTARNLYGTFCFTCHDTNGKGNPGIRVSMPELPDFTALTWQKSRKDADLAHSILDGKGKFMLPMKDKLGSIDVKQMVALVRGFEDGKQTVELEGAKPEGPPLPAAPQIAPDLVSVDAVPLGTTAVGLLVGPAGYGPLLGAAALLPAKQIARGTEPKVPTESAEEAAKVRVGANIFRTYCFVCHGNDGTGELMRRSMPPIPDFTSEAFQKQHTDAQIRVSILDGKGTLMPANRGRITEDQAGSLVAYVRAFGPKTLVSRPGKSDADFDRAVRELERQLEELHKQLQKTKGNP
jgi:mono/diheme cytochrome c family protein